MRSRMMALATLLSSTVLHASASAASVEAPWAAPPSEKDGPPEHTLILGVGADAEIETKTGDASIGANLMLEWDVIEDWLELEAETSLFAVDHGIELPVAILAKKPFRLTRWAEVMVGIGPEMVYVSNPGTKKSFFGGEAAVDFMFWPSRRVGFWIEPAVDLVARDGATSSIGSTGGLLVGW